MKNTVLLIAAAAILTSCGPAAAVLADMATISCTAPTKQTVVVTVDNTHYNVKAKKQKTSKKKSQPTYNNQSKPAAQPAQNNQHAQSNQTIQGNQSDRKTETSQTSSVSRRESTNTSSGRNASASTTSTSSRRSSTVSVEAGEHDVKVTDSTGKEVYNDRVNLSSSEHRTIDLN